jgi:AcrR family transcriptional regulator
LTLSQIDRSVRSERKARGSGHLRRAELLEAAERIFTQLGYEGATIRRIADEVGVSSTAIYMYFQDKSQIMLEICVRAMETQEYAFVTDCDGEAEPLERLRLILQSALNFGFDKPIVYQMLFCPVPRELNERRHEAIAPFKRLGFERTLRAVEEAMAAGRLRAELSPRPVAESLVAACHGAVSLRIANPYAPWCEPEVLSRTLLDGLFRGFQAA